MYPASFCPVSVSSLLACSVFPSSLSRVLASAQSQDKFVAGVAFVVRDGCGWRWRRQLAQRRTWSASVALLLALHRTVPAGLPCEMSAPARFPRLSRRRLPTRSFDRANLVPLGRRARRGRVAALLDTAG
ncbi:hypothetical protein AAT19DRAFT_10480 [Rhodotorula toruloides]|uniref:Uncharacterized protein n=1 Tax=Rhodotorula toruloides TaxID=5286 RepID=A0A2S9ZYV6_RHOTO|nr:hypothetical protein AAT19DRAFT_10480 [Rhodotorula toruloides]